MLLGAGGPVCFVSCFDGVYDRGPFWQGGARVITSGNASFATASTRLERHAPSARICLPGDRESTHMEIRAGITGCHGAGGPRPRGRDIGMDTRPFGEGWLLRG